MGGGEQRYNLVHFFLDRNPCLDIWGSIRVKEFKKSCLQKLSYILYIP